MFHFDFYCDVHNFTNCHLSQQIKEVAPIRSTPEAEKDFFAKDLKVYL